MLTPAYLIYGRRLTSLPESPEAEDDIGCNRRYRHVTERLQHFWMRWSREYLTDLRESLHCNTKKVVKEPKVGDIVIIYKDGVKRNSWKMAIIEDLIQGKDDPVRGAKVRVITKGKVVCLNRPMQMLYTLEVRESVPKLPQHLKSQVERQGR